MGILREREREREQAPIQEIQWISDTDPGREEGQPERQWLARISQEFALFCKPWGAIQRFDTWKKRDQTHFEGRAFWLKHEGLDGRGVPQRQRDSLGSCWTRAMAMRRGGIREDWMNTSKANAGFELHKRNSGILFLGKTFPFPNWTTLKTIIILVNERECGRL